MSSSVLYTVGTALNRACDNHVPVEVLAGGCWLRGQVAAVDGHGVVLATADNEHAVLRIESICAVRVLSPAPHAQSRPAHAPPRTPLMAAPHPMPAGPSAAAV